MAPLVFRVGVEWLWGCRVEAVPMMEVKAEKQTFFLNGPSPDTAALEHGVVDLPAA